jgi:hypothetical protein
MDIQTKQKRVKSIKTKIPNIKSYIETFLKLKKIKKYFFLYVSLFYLESLGKRFGVLELNAFSIADLYVFNDLNDFYVDISQLYEFIDSYSICLQPV